MEIKAEHKPHVFHLHKWGLYGLKGWSFFFSHLGLAVSRLYCKGSRLRCGGYGRGWIRGVFGGFPHWKVEGWRFGAFLEELLMRVSRGVEGRLFVCGEGGSWVGGAGNGVLWVRKLGLVNEHGGGDGVWGLKFEKYEGQAWRSTSFAMLGPGR